MRFIKILLVIAALSFAIGCGGPSKRVSDNRFIERGKIATPGVTIKAVSGNFTLESGKEFKTPFSTNWSKQDRLRYPNLIDNYNKALSIGAQEVRVTVPYYKKTLYGVLSLGDVWSGNSSAGARSYRIEIPESYALAALDGKISVVYESIQDDFYGGSNTDLTWILWLSDQPFPK